MDGVTLYSLNPVIHFLGIHVSKDLHSPVVSLSRDVFSPVYYLVDTKGNCLLYGYSYIAGIAG